MKFDMTLTDQQRSIYRRFVEMTAQSVGANVTARMHRARQNVCDAKISLWARIKLPSPLPTYPFSAVLPFTGALPDVPRGASVVCVVHALNRSGLPDAAVQPGPGPASHAAQPAQI